MSVHTAKKRWLINIDRLVKIEIDAVEYATIAEHICIAESVDFDGDICLDDAAYRRAKKHIHIP